MTELPPLPADFAIPDGLIDMDRFSADAQILFGDLLAGIDARPWLWNLVRESGDQYAILAAKVVFEPVGGWMFNTATVPQAFATTRSLSQLVVTVRELAVRLEAARAAEGRV